jgi:hypothetical protein
MIITQLKPLDEIMEFLLPYRKVMVIGCDGCPQPPRGLKAAKTVALLLEIKGSATKLVTKTIAKQCDRSVIEELEVDGDALLSLACGVGVQTLAEIFQLPVFPAQNTLFMGSEDRQRGLYERCLGCGECILSWTGGICPITRCAKSLLNGPCGGSEGGKCEVNGTDCAWQLIYDRLKAWDKLDVLTEIKPPKDWSTSWEGGPRNLPY